MTRASSVTSSVHQGDGSSRVTLPPIRLNRVLRGRVWCSIHRSRTKETLCGKCSSGEARNSPSCWRRTYKTASERSYRLYLTWREFVLKFSLRSWIFWGPEDLWPSEERVRAWKMCVDHTYIVIHKCRNNYLENWSWFKWDYELWDCKSSILRWKCAGMRYISLLIVLNNIWIMRYYVSIIIGSRWEWGNKLFFFNFKRNQ